MSYKLTGKAETDLQRIYLEDVRLFGIAQASRYHSRFKQVFEILAQNPKMARERTEISPPVRVHPCGSHIIIYISTEDGGVTVVRVRHGREDWIGSD